MCHLVFNSRNVVISSVLAIVLTAIFMSNAAGPVAAGHGGRTGASFDSGSCGGAGCHSGGTALAPSAQTTLYLGSSVVTTYIPGVTYSVRVKVASSSVTTLGYKYGFQTTCVADANDTGINNWGILPSTIHSAVWNGRTYLEQNATLLSTSSPYITIPWTAPPAGTGTVKFYTGGCIVNGNSLPTGDSPVNDSLTVTENTTGCVLPTVVPTIFAASCFGGNDGQITISASGGTGVSAYNWSGPGGYTGATATIAGLYAGTYTLVMTIAGGCFDTVTEMVDQPAAITDSLVGNFPVCNGGNLNLMAYPGGGVYPWTYQWIAPGGMGFATPGVTISPFSATDTGIYWLAITDDNGCVYDTSIDIGLNPGPIFTMTQDTTVCGLDSLVLGITPIPGDTYSWSTGGTNSTITLYSLFTSSYNVYSLTVTDAAGCATTDTVSVITCPLGVRNIGVTVAGISPNPANDFVHIEGDGEISEIVVFDLTGAEVTRTNCGTRTSVDMDVRNLAPGLYTLSIITESGRTMRQLSILR